MFTGDEFDPHAPVFYEGISSKPDLCQKLRDLSALLHAERVASDPGMAEMRLECQTDQEAQDADFEFTKSLVRESLHCYGVILVYSLILKSIDPVKLLLLLAEAVKNES